MYKQIHMFTHYVLLFLSFGGGIKQNWRQVALEIYIDVSLSQSGRIDPQKYVT